MNNAYEVLKERGFLEQCTNEEEVKKLLSEDKVTFYIGFDPTADSLHVGHFVQIMAMSHMQKAGHRPIALLGGGTTMVGDPSGKTDMRKMLTPEAIQHNADNFKKVFEKFIDFSDDKAIMVNNADWLMKLNYIEFLREIGACFSVNKMIAAECYKQRMEKGLTFLEFNYMIMQSFDFYMLNKLYDCRLEFGGNDQWSNIIGGVELVRRKTGKAAYGMTFKLLTTSEGKKMGKTEKGALWLDPTKTTPYEFYQYWRNIDDSDVEKCLSLLTFLPMDEVKKLGALKDQEINYAKEVLAFEITKNIHGEEEAQKAQQAARALFGSNEADDENMPCVEIALAEITPGIDCASFLVIAGLASSKSEARRLIEQGGITLAGNKLSDAGAIITEDDFDDGFIIVKKGKKVYRKVILGL